LDRIAAELGRLGRQWIVDEGAAPGGVVALAVREGGRFHSAAGACGSLDRRPGSRAVELATPYDLASITKPFFATTVARRGSALLGAALGDLLIEARGTPSERVSLELLLAHRAGLEPHRQLYRPLVLGRPIERRPALVEACHARRPECTGPPPAEGFAPVYSDLGYVLAGEAVARALGCDLDRAIQQEVSLALGLDVGSARQWLERDPSFSSRVAPTESVAWRGGALRAVVHDDNAWALAGHGAAGHAGLFGTAPSVAAFGCALLDALWGRSEAWLGRAALEGLVRPRPGGALRAGFDGKSDPGSAAGGLAGGATFGHLGFTGTSLWCDPEAGIVTVVLTNRVCPTRDDLRLRSVRPRLQDALYGLARSWLGH
jgi:serine-type D-Ala-D-Ala carboxypeptidase